MKTSNPALSDRVFEGVRPASRDEAMTIGGTVNKAIISVLITVAVAYWTALDPTMQHMFWIGLIGGLVLWLVLFFKPAAAPVVTPLYAVAEGIVLGTISLQFEQAYGGIVLQAVGLTFATLFVLLGLYRTGVIKATPAFKRGVIAATLAILIYYVISMILSFFGVVPDVLNGNGMLSIGISLVIAGIAALNLVLDFDFIENAAASGSAPKYMEWYGAFALLVTLIWLYVEILRLLSKFQSRD